MKFEKIYGTVISQVHGSAHLQLIWEMLVDTIERVA
jgi:hypothetical protein